MTPPLSWAVQEQTLLWMPAAELQASCSPMWGTQALLGPLPCVGSLDCFHALLGLVGCCERPSWSSARDTGEGGHLEQRSGAGRIV